MRTMIMFVVSTTVISSIIISIGKNRKEGKILKQKEKKVEVKTKKKKDYQPQTIQKPKQKESYFTCSKCQLVYKMDMNINGECRICKYETL